MQIELQTTANLESAVYAAFERLASRDAVARQRRKITKQIRSAQNAVSSPRSQYTPFVSKP